jgi:hypothetical protein
LERVGTGASPVQTQRSSAVAEAGANSRDLRTDH